MQDYYKILQVDEHAEMEVIEAAYRRLAHKYHPDVNPSPDAQEHMRQINLAYETLHDPIKRAQYDRLRGGAETRKETSKEHYKRGPIFSMKDVYQKAGLEHLCREGEWYLFRIAWAKDFHATLNAMKSRIPPRFRYWDTMGKLWHVHSSYEHVLRDLFANFAISKEWSSQSQTSESCSDQQVRPPTYSSAKLVWAGLAAIALLAMFF
ncbi:MAG: DnaJ domain-containing protein, partial [Candidatus Hadarchaeum sp.]